MQPGIIEGEIIDDPEEVSHLLESWALSTAGILAVREAAYIQHIDASPLMASNAPGTLAYHYGVLEMRVQFRKHWEVDRRGGIEAISTPAKDRKLVFQNVDIACSRTFDPKPRTEKGVGTERECQGNLFEYNGLAAPKMVRSEEGESSTAIHFIMVDERGAVEVSRPVLRGGKFVGFVQRLFVSDGFDLDALKIIGDDISDPIEDFDVPISSR